MIATTEQLRTDSAGTGMRPVAFDGIAGWFHPAAGGRGVVIVGAYGYEDLCSRVTLGALADRLASAGLPTLRIDPRGTGDSADLAPNADRIAAWTADVVTAARRLRAAGGIREIVLVGLRIGALIATRAALELGDVDRLVLLAPPPNGRGHRRELSILARLVDGAAASTTADGGIEIAGFGLDGATLTRLATIDLEALPKPPARALTLVGDLGSPAFRRLTESLAAQGAPVDTLPFDGYARMMCDPTASEPALETVARVADHLAIDLPAATAEPTLAVTASLAGDGWVEERLVFGPGLAGVLCRPAGPIDPNRSAIWLNSGRNHHIGWARQSVDLSRRLAVAGVAVLRMDLAGIGDSPARPGAASTALYHDDGKADVVAAVDEMARRGWRRPTVIGACSGAYQAFHTAVEESRIAGLVLINQLCFVWDASYAVHLSAWMMARPHQFEAEARRAEADDGADTAPSLAGRLYKAARRAVRVGLHLLRKLKNSGSLFRAGPIERKFRAFAARGVAVSIVLSEGDKAVEELELHTGPNAARIAGLPGLEIFRIRDADHSLTPAAARAALGDHLIARLTAPAEPATIRSRPDLQAERVAPRPSSRSDLRQEMAS